MLFSQDVEAQFLAGLLRNPQEVFEEIQGVLKVEHFYSGSKLHKTLYYFMEGRLEQGLSLDPVVIEQKIKESAVAFEEKINISEYISNLSRRPVTKQAAIDAAREVIFLFCRRHIFETCRDLQSDVKKLEYESIADLVNKCDKKYNSAIDLFDFESSDKVVNIYDHIEEVIEETGEGEDDPVGPHDRMYKMYGSQVKAGNITVIAARAGSGKTTFALDYATEVSYETGCPVIHFDNGEMTYKELLIRQVATLTGIPFYFINSGKWKNDSEMVRKVRATYKKVKDWKFFYVNVGGDTSDQMISILKRTYFQKVGRGKYCLFSFDYIKTSGENMGNKQEHQVVGDMMDKFKNVIQRQIVDSDRDPCIAMYSSVQSNRSGIVRGGGDIIDDEGSISLSDRIIQIVSHAYILRKKTIEEKSRDTNEFGTHYLINLKARHMGEEVGRAFNEVEVDGEKMKNKICFELKNFRVKEKGDMVDVAEHLKTIHQVKSNDTSGADPELESL